MCEHPAHIELTRNSGTGLTAKGIVAAMSDEPSTQDRVELPSRRVVGYCLATLSAACAVIHFSVAGEHFREYWLFGVFMLVVAWAQLLWAVVAAARPSRAALWAGAGLNVGVGGRLPGHSHGR